MSERGIGVLLRRLFVRSDTQTQAPENERETAPAVVPVQDPPLLALLPAFASVTTYTLRSFEDAHAAAAFFEASKPSAFYREGVIAFWALHQPPPGVADAECAVLVRAGSDQHLVYAYAFVDLDTALSYVRFRVNENQEPLQNFLVYWSAMVTIAANPSGEVKIEPSVPPSAPVPMIGGLPSAAELDVFVAQPEPEETELEVAAREEQIPSLDGTGDGMHPVDPPASIESPTEPETRGLTPQDVEVRPIEPERGAPEPVGIPTIRRYRIVERVREKALALGAAGHSGRQVERELRAAFSRDRVPSYSTITRWLRAAGVGRSAIRKQEAMRTRARTLLEDRFDELDDLPLADVARVVAVIEQLRKTP